MCCFGNNPLYMEFIPIKILFCSVLYHKLVIYWIMVYGLWFMVFNATFNNISVISWWSVLLVKKSGVPGENHRPVACIGSPFLFLYIIISYVSAMLT